MTPGDAKEPRNEIKTAIDSELGGFQKVKEQLTGMAMSRFGSGLGVACGQQRQEAGKSSVSPNQDNPLMDGARGAVIAIDVWEHACYLKYQNKRADYVAAWWNTVNWDKASANYKKATASDILHREVQIGKWPADMRANFVSSKSYPFTRIRRLFSRFQSRFLSVSRLSWSFLPLATATSTFARPRSLKYIFKRHERHAFALDRAGEFTDLALVQE